MALQAFSPDAIIEYVPKYGRNRGSDNPCVVKLHYVPFVKSQEYARLIAARINVSTDKEKATRVAQEVQKRQFIENVVSVSGFIVEGQEKTSPEDLWVHASSELIYEILAAMESPLNLNEGSPGTCISPSS